MLWPHYWLFHVQYWGCIWTFGLGLGCGTSSFSLSLRPMGLGLGLETLILVFNIDSWICDSLSWSSFQPSHRGSLPLFYYSIILISFIAFLFYRPPFAVSLNKQASSCSDFSSILNLPLSIFQFTSSQVISIFVSHCLLWGNCHCHCLGLGLRPIGLGFHKLVLVIRLEGEGRPAFVKQIPFFVVDTGSLL
jgi:hypothetical protein